MALFTVAVTIAVIVLAGSSGPRSDSGAGEAASDGPPNVYAYMKVEYSADWTEVDTRLVLMDGTELIGATDLAVADDPVFTLDGAYAFTHADLLDEITAVSVSTGDQITVPCEGCGDHFAKCNCQTVVPFGGSTIAWLDPENRLVTADLAAETPSPQPTETVVPVSENSVYQPMLIAGTDGLAVASYPHGSFDATAPVYLVPLEGEPRLIDAVRPDSVDEAAFSPDGARLALTGDTETACATVTVVDVGSGKAETSPVLAQPGEECEDRDANITDLWWSPDGTLNTQIQMADNVLYQRHLEEAQWIDSQLNGSAQSLALPTGAALTLTQNDDANGGRTLRFEHEGESERIDRSIRGITAAPEGAAAHR